MINQQIDKARRLDHATRTNLSNKIEEGLGGPTSEGDALIDQLVYQELYDSTKTAAQQIPSKNRFSLQGQFQSSSSASTPAIPWSTGQSNYSHYKI